MPIEIRTPEFSATTSVLIELPANHAVVSMSLSRQSPLPGIRLDPSFTPVPIGAPASPNAPASLNRVAAFGLSQSSVVVRATIRDSDELDQLQRSPDVLGVWADPKIEPFVSIDCQANLASASAAQIAVALGADRVWGDFGERGGKVTIGIVDGGVDGARFPVTGGWSPDPANPPGSSTVAWGGHGNMCAFDALIACPNASVHDYSIGRAGSVPALLSAALQAYQTALVSHAAGHGPQVLSNSWGLYQQSWDPFAPGHSGNYSHNPNHPFNRKVIELLDAGILIAFAAGNCGEACPDSRCGVDVGPSRSIRGANGLPRVVCVGAANFRREWIGYSSEGPSSLDTEKPDVCGYSHFSGFTPCDNGTSAACPVVAGALGLLIALDPKLGQDKARSILRNTANHPESVRWDARFGRGIVDVHAAALALR